MNGKPRAVVGALVIALIEFLLTPTIVQQVNTLTADGGALAGDETGAKEIVNL